MAPLSVSLVWGPYGKVQDACPPKRPSNIPLHLLATSPVHLPGYLHSNLPFLPSLPSFPCKLPYHIPFQSSLPPSSSTLAFQSSLLSECVGLPLQTSLLTFPVRTYKKCKCKAKQPQHNKMLLYEPGHACHLFRKLYFFKFGTILRGSKPTCPGMVFTVFWIGFDWLKDQIMIINLII